jgi:hypothetical protein
VKVADLALDLVADLVSALVLVPVQVGDQVSAARDSCVLAAHLSIRSSFF